MIRSKQQIFNMVFRDANGNELNSIMDDQAILNAVYDENNAALRIYLSGGMGVSGSKLGSWTEGYNYTAGDLVNFQGHLYKAVQDGSGQQPDIGPDYWEPYFGFLGGQYVKDTWFAAVDGQTGSIGPAADNIAATADYQPDEWPDGVDAIACGLDGAGRPDFIPVYDSSGNEINVSSFTTTGASSGDYALSHPPTDDIALVYRYRIQRRYYDDSKSLGDFDVDGLKVDDIQGTENQVIVESIDGQITISLPAAVLNKLVSNGDSHDHSGGDGAQIAYDSLSGTPAIPTAADSEPGAVSGPGTGSAGSSSAYAREDHSHDLGLNADVTAADGVRLSIDQIRARDGDGLKLCDDGGNGWFIKDGGDAGLGNVLSDSFVDESAHLIKLRIGGEGATTDDAGQGALQIRGYSSGIDGKVGTIEFLDGRDDDSIALLSGSRDTFTYGKGNLRFYTSAGNGSLDERMRLDSCGNEIIGGTSAGTSLEKGLCIYNGVAATGNISGVQLYSDSGELKVRDSSGNVTTLSPHDFSLFTPDTDEPFPWSYYSENYHIGKRINVDMAGAIRAIERLSGRQFIYYQDIERVDLMAEQKEQWKKVWLDDNTTEIEIALSNALEEVDVEVETDEVDYEKVCYQLHEKGIKEKFQKIHKKTIKKEWRLKPGIRFCAETGKCFKKVIPAEEQAEAAALKSYTFDVPSWLAVRL